MPKKTLQDQLTMQPAEAPDNDQAAAQIARENKNPHQPLPVKGYTPVEPWKIRVVNVLKTQEERLLREYDGLRAMGDAVDQRGVALAVTYLQTAAMWANRAVFQPARLSDEEMRVPENDPNAGIPTDE